MKVLAALLFAVATSLATARHRKEWQRVDPARTGREHLQPFYQSDLPICTRGAGFYRDPHDCHQFIRCVDEFGGGKHFSVYVSRCDPGLVFDENTSTCNWPELSAPCSNSPEKLQEIRKPMNPGHASQENTISQERWDKPYPVQQQVNQVADPYDPQQQQQVSWQEQVNPDSSSHDSPQQHQEIWEQQIDHIVPVPVAIQESVYQDTVPQQVEDTQTLDEQYQEFPQQEIVQVQENPLPNVEQTHSLEETHQEELKPAADSFIRPDTHQQKQQYEENLYDQGKTNRDSIKQQVSSGGFQEVSEENKEFDVPENVQQEQVPQQETQSQWWVPEGSAQHSPPDNSDQISTPISHDVPVHCDREGFFRHPENCSQFIRCVKIERGAYAVHFFECPKQLVFNEKDSACVIADIQSCRSHKRQKRQTSGRKLKCPGEGFFRNPDDCRAFYRCVKTESGSYETHQFSCPANLVFDEEYTTCNWPEKAPPCDINELDLKNKKQSVQNDKPKYKPTKTYQSTSKPRNDFMDKSITAQTYYKPRTTEKTKYTTRSEYKTKQKCQSQGFFANENDCTKFVKCVRKDDRFVRYELSCPYNYAFDDRSKRCVSQRYVTTCENKVPYSPIRYDDETTSSPETTSSSSSAPSESQNEDIICEQEGYFRHPEDCNRFYRCVDFNGDGRQFVRYDFNCPEGLIFDEVNSVCNWPDPTKPCERRSGGGGGNGETGGDGSEGDNGDGGNGETGGDGGTGGNGGTSEDGFDGGNGGENEGNSSPIPDSQSSTERGETTTDSPVDGNGEQEGNNNGSSNESGISSENGCTKEGFYRNPDDCNKFYRCVDFNGDGKEFVRYDFNCPEGLVFDEVNSVCNWPSDSQPCDTKAGGENGEGENQGGTASTIDSSTNEQGQTSGDNSGSSENPTNDNSSIDNSSNENGSTSGVDTTQSPTDSSEDGSPDRGTNSGECTEAGFFRNPEDCNKFYRCVDFNGDGQQFVRYDFTCPEGLVFDEVNSVCNWPDQSEPCDGGSPGKESTSNGGDGSESSKTTVSNEESSSPITTERPSQTSSTSSNNEDTTNPNEESTPGRESSPNGDSSPGPGEESSSGGESSNNQGECTEAGFFRNPDNCNKFYRCVDFNGDGQQFVRYDFDCPEGLVFDEVNSVCNWPDQSPKCEIGGGSGGTQTTASEGGSSSSSQTETSTSTEKSTQSSVGEPTQSSTGEATSEAPLTSDSSECKESGFHRCKDDCNRFYRCVEEDGRLIRYDFKCPDGLLFDDRNKKCDWPSSQLNCEEDSSGYSTTSDSSQTSTSSGSEDSTTSRSDSSSTSSQTESTTQSSIPSSSGTSNKECTEEGFFRNPDDCSKYYRCIDEGDGRFTREDFACAEDEVFDEEMRYCNRKDLAPPCDDFEVSSSSQTSSSESQTTSSQSQTSQSQTTTSELQSTTERSTSAQPPETTTTSNEKSDCTQPGFFRCADDCSKFYRCVEQNGDSDNLVRYDFRCPDGLIFDERNSKCDFPSADLTCDTEVSSSTSSGSQTTESTSSSGSSSGTSGTTSSSDNSSSSAEGCAEEGFFRNPKDCSKYYRCIDEGDGRMTREDFACAEDEVFDEEMRYCNRRDLAPPCDESASSTTDSSSRSTVQSSSDPDSGSTTQSTSEENGTTSSSGSTSSSSGSGECQEEGFHRDPNDCGKFYRCVDFRGDGQSYTRYDFNCPEGLVFDETNDVCNWPSSVPSCESNGSSGGSTDNSGSSTSSNSDSSTTPSSDQSSSTSPTTGDSSSESPSSGSTSSGGSTRGSSSDIECTEEGFFRNPNDCNKFYRCVDFAGTGESYVRYDFDCPEDLVFDEVNSVCNWPNQTPKCDASSGGGSGATKNSTSSNGESTTESGSSQTTDGSESSTGRSDSTPPGDQTTSSSSASSSGTTTSSSGEFQCQEEGFFKHPSDCKKYYECKRDSDTGELVKIDCECPDGEVWDNEGWYCNAQELSPPCENNDSSFQCTEEGFFRDPEDCTRYYQCNRTGPGQNDFRSERFQCEDGLVFDENGRYCNAPELSEPCDGSSSTSSSTANGDSSSSSTPSPSDNNESSSSSTADASDTQFQCTREGFFRDPEDCTKYYQCMRNEDTGEIERTDCQCPDGRIFDETSNYCNEPELSGQPCDSNNNSESTTSQQGSSTDTSTSESSGSSPSTGTRGSGEDPQCTQEGFYRHPEDCNKFYRCVDFSGSGESFVRYDFDCPEGLHFDEINSVCNWPTMTPPCESGNQYFNSMLGKIN